MPRFIILTGLAALAVPAWYFTAQGAWDMYHMAEAPNMWMPHAGPWTLTEFWLLFVMWTVMMAAMMLPSVAPLTLTFASVHGRPYAATASFVGGYLAAWTLFSAGATVVQYTLHQTAILSPMMISRNSLFGATVLCVAGIFQLTPWKYLYLGHCRNAKEIAHTRQARVFPIGFRHGVCCVSCCWALMALLFVTGVMDLTWVAAITVLVLLERVMPGGPWLARASGAALIAWGLAL